MHQWLLQGNQPANPPPPYDRETRRQSFPSSAPIGVEAILGSSHGVPHHIRENLECEQKFKRLPFAAIELFPAAEQKWDADKPGPCPLQNGSEWSRGRGRRIHFNPRSLKKERDRSPAPVPVGRLPATESTPTPTADEGGEVIRTPAVAPEPTTTPHDGAAREDAVETSPTEERPPSSNAWAGDGLPLGREDRPDLRGCPSRGALFGGLRPVPRDGRDPPRDACFNCRQGGHTRFNSREPPSLFCYNCGRRETTLRACPRCGEAHLEYLREQGRATRHDVRGRRSGQSPEPRGDRRYPPIPPPARHQHLESRGGHAGPSTAPPAIQASAEMPPPAQDERRRETPGSTQATPSAPRLGLTDYFASIQHLPGDLQETLLRAYLAQ